MVSDDSWLLRHINFLRCSQSSLFEGWKFSQELLLINFAYRLLMQNGKLSPLVRHLISMCLGNVLLFSNIGLSYLWPVGLMLGAYSAILFIKKVLKKDCGSGVAFLVLAFLLICEIFVMKPKMWQQIRGIQMVIAMKVISVSMDVDSGILKETPDIIEYAGYVLCPANAIMGPWVPFSKYEESLVKIRLNFRWIFTVTFYLIASLLALVLSTCFVPLYLGDDGDKWVTAYRDALSFRMSHYFVSAISQTSMTAAGFGPKEDGGWEVQVANPFHVELPRSLVQVVIHWNVPMHKWLKAYVFKPCSVRHGQFVAIFATYSVSSLLHGLNFQLSAVLLSIGLFSFAEYKVRLKLSKIFNCCCLASPCGRMCNHTRKNYEIFVIFINLFFSISTVMHLAYLGVMFEASFSVQETGYSYLHTLGKWKELDYTSHIFSAYMYLIFILLCYFN